MLPIHRAITGYDTYRTTGECYLTEDAYTQCVDWRTQGRWNPIVGKSKAGYGPQKGANGGNMYLDKVAVIDPETGMAKMETRLVENTYKVEPTW